MPDLSDRFFNNKKWVHAILILAPLLLYAKSLFYDFSPMDDQWLIVKNYQYLHQWNNLLNAFREPFSIVYYRPLVTVSFIIDSHLGKLNPGAFHFTNLVIHLACVLLLNRLLLLLNVKQQTAFWLALIFAVHPVLLHAVAWIPGRTDLLLCLFTLPAIIYLLHYLSSGKALHLFLHFLFFVLALFVKESAVLLPLVFAWVYLCRDRLNKRALLLLVFGMLIALCWYVLKVNVVNNSFKTGPDMLVNIKNLLAALVLYLGKAFFPVQQSLAPTFKNSSILPGLLAVIALLVSFFKPGMQDKRVAYLGIFMFIVLLVLPAWYGVNSSLGEHYEQRIYTSLAGILLMAGQLKFNPASRILKFVFPAICILFAAKTFYRMDIYKNQDTFMTAGVKECPDNYAFCFQQANSLYNKRDFAGALGLYTKAIQLNPGRSELYSNRAGVYVELKKKDEAIADYSKAMVLTNNNPGIYLKRCITYYKFGDIEGAMQDLEGLKKCCKNYIPAGLEDVLQNSWADYVLATLNARIAADPHDALLYVNRAKAYMDRRMGAEALADLKKACELEPANKEYRTYYNALSSTFPHK